MSNESEANLKSAKAMASEAGRDAQRAFRNFKKDCIQHIGGRGTEDDVQDMVFFYAGWILANEKKESD